MDTVCEGGDGMVVVDVARAGVDFTDARAIRNDYLTRQELPLIPGAEVSGTTPDGKRVAAMSGNGTYAQKVAVPEAFLVPIPDGVNDDQAAGLLLQGVTAHALSLLRARARGRDRRCRGCRRRYRLPRGAARQAPQGPGRRPSAWIDEERLRRAPEHGRDHRLRPVVSLTGAIIEANGGDKVDVVLHMGGTGFEGELKALRHARQDRGLRGAAVDRLWARPAQDVPPSRCSASGWCR